MCGYSVACVRHYLLHVRIVGGQIGKAQAVVSGDFCFPISQFFCNSNLGLFFNHSHVVTL